MKASQMVYTGQWGQPAPRVPFNSLELWHCILAATASQPISTHLDRDAHPRVHADLLSNSIHAHGDTCIAIDFPFAQLTGCQQPASSNAKLAVRRFLDHLCIEMRLLGALLNKAQAVQHLWWLGDPTPWLDPAQMTEVMYRLGQHLHVRKASLQHATLTLSNPVLREGSYALLRGLGFDGLLFCDASTELAQQRSDRLTSFTQMGFTPLQIRNHRTDLPFNQRIIPLQAARLQLPASPSCMIGLGPGAWSMIDQGMVQNACQLDSYYEALTRNELPSQALGSWHR